MIPSIIVTKMKTRNDRSNTCSTGKPLCAKNIIAKKKTKSPTCITILFIYHYSLWHFKNKDYTRGKSWDFDKKPRKKLDYLGFMPGWNLQFGYYWPSDDIH